MSTTAGDGSATAAGGVSVAVGGAARAAQAEALAELVRDKVAGRLAGKDATLWGEEARAEAEIRLGWIDLPSSSRALLPELDRLAAESREAGLDHVVLAGMGGSSLAPEVIAAAYGRPLTVLDTTDPHQVRTALAERLERTVVVVSSKSGGTVETDSHRRIYEAAFREAGIDPAERIVVVTDPGSPLEAAAREAGYRVVLADPNVGGRYSALTAFGLVPSALAGVDVAELLDDAAAAAATLAGDDDNPALALGAALGGFGRAGNDKVVIAPATGPGGAQLPGFGDWAEQLIAESTGKNGRGLLPVVVESADAPGFAPAADTHLVTVGPVGAPAAPAADTHVAGGLGGQFLVWEYATAVAGRLLEIDPFNQPNVQESKDNTNRLLAEAGDGPLSDARPLLVDGAVEVHAADAAVLGGAADLPGALAALAGAVPATGYLAVMAYLDRLGDAPAARTRALLAERLDHPVTFGWGPRFLHSTGQYHKGGPAQGVFLQITGESAADVAVPGRPYSLARLQLAQALGDFGAISGRDRPVVRLHLRDRAAGLARLLAALESVPERSAR
ncbi:glucose-6-phosphate isomerase [Allonocardiopsis opalescens]|uniref:Glucose-6-phosphate isomerase n=1 Tax=Allonocardiopsis opalescens TaxID=1144618 RepID=A0A2T0PUQ8_9ACTN|nr:glucose-6-phosphate isomerase [Allonocardiopsis opalescens]PRX92538.1 glucose-6-phosphate isomerase [Allonocardiopsis opalescens]